MPRHITEDKAKEIKSLVVEKLTPYVGKVTDESVGTGGLYPWLTFKIVPKKVERETLFGNEKIVCPEMYAVLGSLGKTYQAGETNREYKFDLLMFPEDVLLKFKIVKV